MLKDDLVDNPHIERRKPKKDFLKRSIAIFAILFMLFVVPATVNLSLSSQDVRQHAQVISESSASNARTDVTSQNSSNSNVNFFWQIYPFLLGLVIIIWFVLIFIYLGTKFRSKL